MRQKHATLGLAAMLTVLLACQPARASENFPLHDGDTWVMAGDSITAQHLHSNYFEAFCYARYQAMRFRFRNSGVGGDTIPKVLARYDWDIAPWKPTVVSVELGMNDKGGYSVEQYIQNMGQLDARIRSSGARPVYFTASPVNSGSTSTNLGINDRLDTYARALKKFAAQHDAPFADQFHALLDVWGANKPQENRANLIATVAAAAREEQLPGVSHLRNFLAEMAGVDPQPVSMQGDAVHPGPNGQLMMAAALLSTLNAEPHVSSASLDSAGKVLDSDGCTITGARAVDGGLAFERLDQRLPFPIPAGTYGVLPLFPTILQLSDYTLKVAGLPAGQYELRANGQKLGHATAEDLAAGVNLTAFASGPIAAQGQAILDKVARKEGFVGQWRGVSHAVALGSSGPDSKARLAALAKTIEDADQQIRNAAQPQRLQFEVRPVK
ncbi:MAG TPA: GDSL-type esterase/lipase family protein [Pirellulales bacterium]